VKGYNLKHNALAKEDGRQREWYLRRTYDISLEDYESLFAAQRGRCAICRGEVDGYLHVDHDHATGQVRGLLCNKCNMAIGLLQDDPAITRNATEYLDR
jgi:hypothetical protein